MIKDKVLLTTEEIRDGVKAAEEEAQAKKQSKGKKKNPKTPSDVMEPIDSEQEVE